MQPGCTGVHREVVAAAALLQLGAAPPHRHKPAQPGDGAGPPTNGALTMKKILVIAALAASAAAFTATTASATEYGHARVRGGLNPASTVQAPHRPQQMQHGHARVRGGLNPANTLQAPHKPQQMQHGHARVRGGLNPADTLQAPQDPQKGLLLPAVQHARDE